MVKCILTVWFFGRIVLNSDIVFNSYIVYFGFTFLVCKFEKEKKKNRYHLKRKNQINLLVSITRSYLKNNHFEVTAVKVLNKDTCQKYKAHPKEM